MVSKKNVQDKFLSGVLMEILITLGPGIALDMLRGTKNLANELRNANMGMLRVVLDRTGLQEEDLISLLKPYVGKFIAGYIGAKKITIEW